MFRSVRVPLLQQENTATLYLKTRNRFPMASPCILEAFCSRTSCGDELRLCGWDEALGAWQVERSLKLHTDPETFPLWKLQLPPCSGDFKLLVKRR